MHRHDSGSPCSRRLKDLPRSPRCHTGGGPSSAKGGLRLHRALHGFNGAPELRKDAITRRVRYAAPVFSNEPVEDYAPFGQPFERADLVSAHEAAVALDICCEDCDEASADFRGIGHACPMPTYGHQCGLGGVPASTKEGIGSSERSVLI